MQARKICFDRATLDDKIILDNDEFLVMPSVIASEIVHEYASGWAYKPADELKKAAWTADGRWVKILSHPETALLQTADDIFGRVENPKFVKNLMDPKTKRPCRKGIRADIKWFKDRVPAPVIAEIKSGSKRAVSIGFTFEEDRTPGKFNNTPYDFVQRNIFIDHVAAPIDSGRCPGPLCGIAVDTVLKIAHDPFGEYASIEECIEKNTGKEEIKDPAAYCAEIKSKIEGEQDKLKNFVTAADLQKCAICRGIVDIGLLPAVRRLLKVYGKDVFYVIQGKTPPPLKIPETSETIYNDAEAAIKSADWLLKKR